MEIILKMEDIGRGRGKAPEQLELCDFYTMDLHTASLASKITFVYEGRRKIILKDRDRQ